MNIREISKPVTAASLNESLAKRFGKRIALEHFTLEQLHNARNKLRTDLFNVETKESFNAVKTEAYQKSKLFLDVLNAEISEREDIAEAKPDFLDLDKDGNKKEPMKKAAKDAKKKKAVKEGGSKNSMMKDAETMSKAEFIKKYGKENAETWSNMNESVIKEGAEEAAELVMAAKDMVDRITSWMEDTAEMQTESMLELADSIRDEMGSEQSEAFVNSVKPALEALYTALESTREATTAGVGILTGEAAPQEPMGDEEVAAEPEMEPTVDAEADMEAPAEDDGMAAAEPAVGGEEEAGRAKRESIERSRKLGTLLSKKK
jgi:hypothetical protein